MADCRPVILVCNTVFWPGNDASGVNQSLPALARALSDRYRFRFLSRDRPFGAASAMVEAGRWHDLGFGDVYYLAPSKVGLSGLGALIRDTPHQILYLNGFFDRWFTLPLLLMRRTGRVPRTATILSPRGEFSSGALGLKSVQKAGYIAMMRSLGLLKDVVLHGTSEAETQDIKAGFARAGGYETAPNVREPMEPLPRVPGERGTTRIVFIGRISPVKNLDFALRVLSRVRSPVRFDVYGPREDSLHWAECAALIAALPGHVVVKVHGEIAVSDVPAVLAAADLFFLPSRSENFGHSIFEALSCGVPALVGDQTPWRGLAERDAGWDLPLMDAGAFVAAIEEIAAADPEQRARKSAAARTTALAALAEARAVPRNEQMIESVLKRARLPDGTTPAGCDDEV
jgi:glycosyltransferase involved in cell wall biosynthesis